METRTQKRPVFRDERDLFNFTRSYLSEAFPNPERKGCPADHVLRDLARRPSSTDDSIANHLTCCSPCFTKYMAYLQHAKAEQPSSSRVTFRPVFAFIGAALVIAALAFFITKYSRTNRQTPVAVNTPRAGAGAHVGTTAKYVPVVIDLTGASPVRGPHHSQRGRDTKVIPSNSLIDLTLQLPLGSEARRYSVQMKSHANVAWSGSAVGHLENGRLLLRIRTDLSRIPEGKYDLLVSSKSLRLSVPVLLKSISSGG